MNIIRIYQVEIKGQTFELNEKEFQDLRKAVDSIREDTSIQDLAKEFRRMNPPQYVPPYTYPERNPWPKPMPEVPNKNPYEITCKVTEVKTESP